MVPPLASSKRPTRELMAPVKAPFSCPNSSDSIRSRGIAPQLSGTNGSLTRELLKWIVFATSSFPVPLSPVMRTVLSVSEIFSMKRWRSCIRREFPISFLKLYFSLICFLRTVFSFCSFTRSNTLLTVIMSSSRLNGFVM